MSEAIERSTLGKRLAAHSAAAEVIRRSLEGETPVSIATWLQEDMLLFTEAGREELEGAIKEHFLTEVPLEERLEIARKGRSAIAMTVAKQRKRQTARQRLETLFDLQLGRIELAHETEAGSGQLYGGGANEIEIARRIAMNIHEVGQDTGEDTRPTANHDDVGRKIGLALLSLMRDRENPQRIEVESRPKQEDDVVDAEFREVSE